MKKNYDQIAPFYDRLSRVVFGRGLMRAQRFLLSYIPDHASVLIAGGGTGWIIEEIARLHPGGLDITYIDASPEMTTLARKRNPGACKVDFIVAPVEKAVSDKQYDVIFTAFFFDNFSDRTAEQIFKHIHDQLKDGGLWLFCDFRNTGVMWQKGLMKTMYVFFRLCCGIEARQLPDMARCFRDAGYKVVSNSVFIRGFVFSEVSVK